MSDSMAPRGRIVLVDDDLALCSTLALGLRKSGFAVHAFTSSAEVLADLGALDPEAVITDLRMSGMDGLELCERCKELVPGVPVIVLTAFGSLEAAVGAIRAGAYDFVSKPVDVEMLEIAADRAIDHRRLEREVQRLRQDARPPAFDELIGESEPMRRLYDLVARIAETDVSVLISGESGTGKELVARALHRRSPRVGGPFVAVNCAALPEALLESELFGHVRGAFTDARDKRTGLFVAAGGGTLFLDEIAEIPLSMQAKLLRALQERAVRPVGSDQEVSFDARVISATNRDLLAEVEAGRFREDLYFRLSVVPLHLPPLRARGRDILLLAQHLLERSSSTLGRPVRGMSSRAAEKLLSYRWPGNVRELQNCIDHAVALARYDKLAVEDLPERVREYKRSDVLVAAEDPSELPTMDEVERRYVMRVLESVDGHRAAAARILGLDRKTLYRKLESWRRGGE
jgi:DNA-binding NtrC family response regulator